MIYKALTGCTLILLSLTVLAVHQTEQLYPWSSIFIFLVVCQCILFARTLSVRPALILLVGAALLHRALIISYPASVAGLDTDRYVAAAQMISDQGNLTPISESFFYINAPIFHVYTSIISQVLETSPQITMYAYSSLTVAVVGVTTAALLYRSESYVVIIGIALSTVMGALLFESVAPRPSLLALNIFVIILLLIFKIMNHKSDKRFVALFVSLTAIAAFTHKFPVALVFVVLISIIAGYLLRTRIINFETEIQVYRRLTTVSLISLLCLTLLILLLHWMFITSYYTSVMSNTIFSIFTYAPSPDSVDYLAAEPVVEGWYGIFTTQGYWIVVAPIAAISWLISLRHRHSDFLVGSAAAMYSLLIIAVLAPVAASARRIVGFSEMISVLLVCGFVAAILNNCTIDLMKKGIVGILLLMIIFSQLSGSVAAPDHPGETRLYLEKGEIVGKQFAAEHAVQEVYTDSFYASRNVGFSKDEEIDVVWQSGSGRTTDGFTAIGDPLFNGTITQSKFDYILIRSQVNVYRHNGDQKLTYNPIKQMNNDTETQKVYTNGMAKLYRS